MSETRDPAPQGRQASEAGIFTSLAVVLSFFVKQWQPEMPGEVLAAFGGLVVGLGTILMSHLRNRQHAGQSLVGLGLVVGLLILPGCVSYDGERYHQLATNEEAALSEVQSVTVARCEAHLAGAAALRDRDGDASALLLPYGSGGAVGPFASKHQIQAAACYQLLLLIGRDEASAEAIKRVLRAWRRQWKAGDDLLGAD